MLRAATQRCGITRKTRRGAQDGLHSAPVQKIKYVPMDKEPSKSRVSDKR